MNPPKKLTSQQKAEQEQILSHGHSQQQDALEFENAEDLLRHDALHTPIPPSIANRLQASLDQHPPAKLPWWRRLFGR